MAFNTHRGLGVYFGDISNHKMNHLFYYQYVSRFSTLIHCPGASEITLQDTDKFVGGQTQQTGQILKRVQNSWFVVWNIQH